MTSALRTLKRIHRTAVEDAAKIVADIAAQRAAVQQLIDATQAQMNAETLAAATDPLAAAMLPAFIQKMRARVATLRQNEQALAHAEDRARDALAAAFLEEQKIERLMEAAAEREAMAELVRDAQYMDELAIMRARLS